MFCTINTRAYKTITNILLLLSVWGAGVLRQKCVVMQDEWPSAEYYQDWTTNSSNWAH